MQIVVIQGDDTARSWARVQKIIAVARARGWEISKYEFGQPLSLAEVVSSGNLFANERLFIVEDARILGKGDFVWLAKNQEKFAGKVLLYFDGFPPANVQRMLPRGAKSEEYKLPKTIFRFLDGLYPGNGRRSVILFHQLKSVEPVELVFNLIAKRFKELYWVKKAASTLNYPAWRKTILRNQAAKYTDPQLSEIITSLARADVEVKTGQTSLGDVLDLIILTKLE